MAYPNTKLNDRIPGKDFLNTNFEMFGLLPGGQILGEIAFARHSLFKGALMFWIGLVGSTLLGKIGVVFSPV